MTCLITSEGAELVSWILSRLLWSIAWCLKGWLLLSVKEVAQAVLGLLWRHLRLLLLHLCKSSILICWLLLHELRLSHVPSLAHCTLSSWHLWCASVLLTHHVLHHVHHVSHLSLHSLHLHLVLALSLSIHVQLLHLLLHLCHLLHVSHLLRVLLSLHSHGLLGFGLWNSRLLRERVLPSRIPHIVTERVT